MDSIEKLIPGVVVKMGDQFRDTPFSANRGDSYLEERFWTLIDDTIGGREGSLDQFEIDRFRVDAIFRVPTGAVVVELDGSEYHRDRSKDNERDSRLLHFVTSVIRIPYADLTYRPRSTMYTLATIWERFKAKPSPVWIPYRHSDNPHTASLNIRWRSNGRTDPSVIERLEAGQRKLARKHG